MMLGGGALNYGTYAGLTDLGGIWRRYDFLAVGMGAIAGLCFNYPASRFIVFRRPASIPTASAASPVDP